MECVLPTGFVHYKIDDLPFQVSLRYATPYNFVGEKIDGYYSNNSLVLTEATAKKLFEVQQEVAEAGYSLLVYDAYRPAKAVAHFMRWTSNDEETTKHIYHPYIPKDQVIKQGYVAPESSHSRGSTLDLTLIPQGEKVLEEPVLSYRTLRDGRQIPFYDDNSVDMGSSFDLFDQLSHPTNHDITWEQSFLRIYLRKVMIEHGFTPLNEEWWHFTDSKEPFPEECFDFDICEEYLAEAGI